MKKQIVLGVFLACILTTSFSQTKETDKRLKGFDTYVTKVMSDWKVQGLAIAIVEKNKVVLIKGYGFRNTEQKLPVTPETLFAIGSCTKAFTAAGLCILQDEGKIDLDKPVRDVMPEFALYDEYASQNITPRDLLSHRSGLPRHDYLWYGSPFTRSELMSRLKYLEPSKPLRTSYQYQNLMFLSAGYLSQKISGQSWEVFTTDRLLTPMGMISTNFTIDDLKKAKDFATGYFEIKNKVETIPYMNIDAMAPAGSINSSATDMSKWLLTLINGGKLNGKEILSASTVRQMQTPTMVLPAAVPIPYDESFYNVYGLGWIITSYRGHLRVEHGGNIDGFSASTCFLPKDSVGIVVLTNMNGTALTSIVRNNIIDRMLGLNPVDWNNRLLDEAGKAKANEEKNKKEEDTNRVKDTKPSHSMAAYAGTFENPAYGDFVVSVEGESIQANLHGLATPLEHYHYDIFKVTNTKYFEGEKVTFITNVRGEIDAVQIKLEPGVKDIVFTRRIPAKEVGIATLQNYVGEFDFGGQVAKTYFKGEKTLYLLVPGQPEYELVPIADAEFKIKSLEGFKVKFETDTRGKVTDLISIQPNGTYRAKRK